MCTRAKIIFTIAVAMLASNRVSQCRGQDRFFTDVIAPIFQQRCLNCHDDQTREGGFSLQTAQAAFEDGYIEPGQPDESYLVQLITPVDGQAQMPHDGDPLSDDNIRRIREWIQNGADWPKDLRLQATLAGSFDWWSFQPIVRPDLPGMKDRWIRTPIDSFILEALQQRGLTPVAEADRRSLLRRVTYDLTGLPPTIEETEAFVNDSSENAYEKVVDRLLASPHYGERWARHWLDVVKYADTCGYDKDKMRPNAWPYRDYVIRSLNEDKPYGQFVREQVAGDALYPGQPDGILGLGLIAAGPWDFIGHVEVAESKIDGKVARNLDRDDMVSNVINTFCSVTIQCARCHQHKFDPFSQEHYYSLQAVFAAVDRAERTYDVDPKLVQQRRQLQRQQKELKKSLVALNEEIDALGGAELEELRRQVGELGPPPAVDQPAEFGFHSQIEATRDSNKWLEIELPEPLEITKLGLQPCWDDFAGIGAGFGFPVRFQVFISSEPKSDGKAEWKLVADYSESDFPNPGLDRLDVSINASQKVRRIRMQVSRLAERRNDYMFALAEVRLWNQEEELSDWRQAASVKASDSIEMPPRWQAANLIDGQWPRVADPARYQGDAKARAGLQVMLDKLQTDDWKNKRSSLQSRLEDVEQKLASLPIGKQVYAAAVDFSAEGQFKPTGGQPRPIHVLNRGDVERPGKRVGPGVLPLGANEEWRLDPALSESERRAALAKWLTRKDHPLVWRSIVNRIWQYHFGRGIVATPNDFGQMGAKPTHPELLDWLAIEFAEHGGSFKHLHRLIVTSSVYRQSSNFDQANANIDGSNQYLWRMNRRRLSAEEVRDSILMVSGKLDTTMGGPGFYLFELERPEHSPHYEYHKFDPNDPESHRRSIYRFVVRSQPDPWMTTLDCADSSQSTPRRNETLTSLQALSLLNSRFNLAMAEHFAAELSREHEAVGAQVDLAFQRLLQRSPTDAERLQCGKFAAEHGLDNLCRYLFNLNEFVYLD